MKYPAGIRNIDKLKTWSYKIFFTSNNTRGPGEHLCLPRQVWSRGLIATEAITDLLPVSDTQFFSSTTYCRLNVSFSSSINSTALGVTRASWKGEGKLAPVHAGDVDPDCVLFQQRWFQERQNDQVLQSHFTLASSCWCSKARRPPLFKEKKLKMYHFKLSKVKMVLPFHISQH